MAWPAGEECLKVPQGVLLGCPQGVPPGSLGGAQQGVGAASPPAVAPRVVGAQAAVLPPAGRLACLRTLQAGL